MGCLTPLKGTSLLVQKYLIWFSARYRNWPTLVCWSQNSHGNEWDDATDLVLDWIMTMVENHPFQVKTTIISCMKKLVVEPKTYIHKPNFTVKIFLKWRIDYWKRSLFLFCFLVEMGIKIRYNKSIILLLLYFERNKE